MLVSEHGFPVLVSGVSVLVFAPCFGIYLTEDTKAVLYYFTVFSLVFLVSCASSVCVCVLVLCSGVCVFVFNT